MIDVIQVPFKTIERSRRMQSLLDRAIATNVRLLKGFMSNPKVWARMCKHNPNLRQYAKNYGL